MCHGRDDSLSSSKCLLTLRRTLALIVEEIINMLEFYEPQADFGTPEIESENMVTLSIDGADVTVPEGTSVMRAAAEKGIKIPRL